MIFSSYTTKEYYKKEKRAQSVLTIMKFTILLSKKT